MRLIDADALKRNFKLMTGKYYDYIIDTAPTVVVDCKNCDGYEAGYSAGMRDTERPKGEIFPMEIVAGKCPIEVGGNCPLKPQGEWEYTTHHARRYRICPFCKCEKEDDRSAGWFYCWHCGADMRKGGADK